MPNLLNLIFPPQCMCCETLVPTHGTLCLECWNQVPFISPPFCAQCGLPLEYVVDEHTRCGACLQESPPYSRARSAFVYNDTSRSLVIKLKYHDESYLAPTFARWLMSAGGALIASSDAIIPVPLHYGRLISRRYNQAQLLAKELSKITSLPLRNDVLKRVRATQKQTGLTRAQRAQNMRNAFAVTTKYEAWLRGKSVLLIDDVMTTGATIHACTETLLEAGAASVNVLTLARTKN